MSGTDKPRFARGIRETKTQGRRGMPKCRPCTRGDHQFCPTAITRHTTGDFHSTYECPCYDQDPIEHAARVEEHDANFEVEQEERRDESRWDSGPDGMLHGF